MSIPRGSPPSPFLTHPCGTPAGAPHRRRRRAASAPQPRSTPPRFPRRGQRAAALRTSTRHTQQPNWCGYRCLCFIFLYVALLGIVPRGFVLALRSIPCSCASSSCLLFRLGAELLVLCSMVHSACVQFCLLCVLCCC